MLFHDRALARAATSPLRLRRAPRFHDSGQRAAQFHQCGRRAAQFHRRGRRAGRFYDRARRAPRRDSRRKGLGRRLSERLGNKQPSHETATQCAVTSSQPPADPGETETHYLGMVITQPGVFSGRVAAEPVPILLDIGRTTPLVFDSFSRADGDRVEMSPSLQYITEEGAHDKILVPIIRKRKASLCHLPWQTAKSATSRFPPSTFASRPSSTKKSSAGGSGSGATAQSPSTIRRAR